MNAIAETETPKKGVNASRSELMVAGAADPEFFESYFFPKTVRQKSAAFHGDVWRLLESNARMLNIQMFRGSAKTTKLRIFAAKRVAYGLARTVLCVGKSEGHATRTVKWLRTQIEFNQRLKSVFKLSKGSKWQDTECIVKNELAGHETTILALGVTGSVRGVNVDDYRPDLIIVDDIVDEDNANTEEQRNKISDLVYGALLQSLAPTSESPDAKIAVLQTPLNREDFSTLALKDKAWNSAKFGCWTPDTADMALDQRESAWPERFTSAELRKMKMEFIARNKASVYNREMECRITSPETSSFMPSWLRFYEALPSFENLEIVVAIDPVPPPTPVQLAKGLKGKDYEVLSVWAREINTGQLYLLEYSMNRGHEPSWTIERFFYYFFKYNPSRYIVEMIAYQRTLEWILRQAMRERGIFCLVEEMPDRRSKYDRIVDAYSGVASNGMMYVSKAHTEFISQFTEYPAVTHDDVLDAGAMAIASFKGKGMTTKPRGHTSGVKPLKIVGGAP